AAAGAGRPPRRSRRGPQRGARVGGGHRGFRTARRPFHPGHDARRSGGAIPSRDGARGRRAGAPAHDPRLRGGRARHRRAPAATLRGTMSEVVEQLRQWITTAWDPELSLLEWRTRLADAGWACPTWPREWGGRSLPAAAADAVTEALSDAGVPGPPDGVGMHLAAPTILEHGSEPLKARPVRPVTAG